MFPRLEQICDYLGYPVTSIETFANLCERYKRCISAESEESIIRTLLSNSHPRMTPKKPRSSGRGGIAKRRTGLQRATGAGSESHANIILAEPGKQTQQQNDGDWLCQSPSPAEVSQDTPMVCDDLDGSSARSQTAGQVTSYQCKNSNRSRPSSLTVLDR